MSTTAFLVGGILPYAAVMVFLAGVTHRLIVWWRAPQPVPMTLYPTEGAGWKSLAREALFFPSLYRGDKPMWMLAWLFHLALAFAFVGHFRAVTGLLDWALGGLGLDGQALPRVSAAAGGVAGLVLFLAATLLLLRRAVIARVRESSGVPDFLALLLVLAVIVTGNLLRFGARPVDLTETRLWASSLLAFSPLVPTTPGLLVHLFSAELLVLYLAFSKLMHFGGFFFTFALHKRSQP